MKCSNGKRLIVLFISFFIALIVHSQVVIPPKEERRANIWLFGDIGLDFNCSPPRVMHGDPLSPYPSKINTTTIGTSVLSDQCGDMLYYCNGDTIWDNFNSVVASPAIPLAGSRLSTQSSLILPDLNDPKIFYFFTVDGDEANNFKGLSYSEMHIGGSPLFPVTNQTLVQFTNEMVTATSDGFNGYWVVTKLKGKREFRSYHVTSTGVNTTAVVSSAGVNGTEVGQLKFSPDGRYLAIARPFQVFRFDKKTGKVIDFTGPIGNGTISSTVNWLDDGNTVEFSPSGDYVYINNFNEKNPLRQSENGIWQYNLALQDPVIIDKNPWNIGPGFVSTGGFQLGPDGVIYIIQDSAKDKISAILKPNLEASLCEFKKDYLDLRLAKPGTFFPNFNQSWFAQPNVFFAGGRCHNDSTYFEFNDDFWFNELDSNWADSVNWEIVRGADTIKSTERKFALYFDVPGCYQVTVGGKSIATGLGSSLVKSVRINRTPTTELGPSDTTLCFKPRQLFRTVSTADNLNSDYTWYFKSFADIAAGIPDLGIPAIGFLPDMTIKEEGRFWVVKTFKCCSYSDTIHVYHDSIIPIFKVNDGLQCERDNKYVYTNVSTPVFKTTKWDFGDGTYSTDDIATKHYAVNGTYYPEMTTTSEKGCVAKLKRTMLVVKHPVARFVVDTSQQCFQGNIFKIKDSSYIDYGHGSIQKWTFDLGDSSKVTQKQFTKHYTKAGFYTVMLALNSSQDCKDTAYTQVRVFSQPQAAFTINDTSQCRSANDFVFTDTSTTDLDSINYRYWFHGDGSPPEDRTTLSRQHNRSFTSVDSFKVLLKVGTGPGCYDSIAKQVYINGDPFVDFSTPQPQQCLNGNVFNFQDTTYTPKGFVQTLQWDFGDSTPISSSGLNKKYQVYGAYTVKLKAITNHGCTDSVSKNVLLHPMPQAGFTTNQTATCFKNHNFILSAAPSFVSVGSISGFLWEFGDGNTSTLKDPPAKTYTQDTAHLVKLLVTSDKNCTDTAKKLLEFYPTPVAVAQVANPIQCLEENIFYYRGDSSTAGTGTITEYLWQFGDGTIDEGPTPGGKFYINPDTLNIQLKITTDKGCVDTTSLQVRVLPSPVANFSVDPSCLFQPSEFIDKSSSNPGTITSWNWHLGDGTQTADSDPIHTYDNTGAYTVSLSVESNYGCRATVTKVNEAIVKALPQAKFSFEKTDFDEQNTTVQFIDSSIDAGQWLWDLGNGIISTQQNPLIVFNDTATLPVQLIIGNVEGCFDTLRKTIFVAPDFFFHVPTAFTPNKDEHNPLYGGEGTRYFKEYYLRIYNRWGQLVFEADNPLKRWDGKHNGEACPVGAYTFVYRLMDVFGLYHNYSGIVTLIR